MKIRLLLLAVAGLILVLFIALQKNAALRYEVGFLTTHYELLVGNNRELRQVHINALVKVRTLQGEIIRLNREKTNDEVTDKLAIEPGSGVEFFSGSQFEGSETR